MISIQESLESKRFPQSLFYGIVGYNFLLYGIMLIRLFANVGNGIFAISRLIVLLIFITLLPVLFASKVVTAYKVHSFRGSIAIFFLFYLISLPFLHAILFETLLMGQGNLDIYTFAVSGKISLAASSLGGILGLLLNLIYIFWLRLHHK